MNKCIFCKIANREINSEIIAENKDYLIFKDIKPSAPVHYLVVPKKHIKSIAHLRGNHRGMIAMLIFAAKNTAKKIGLKGYKLIFNVGKEGGQIIDHLHLHLLGGWQNHNNIELMNKKIASKF